MITSTLGLNFKFILYIIYKLLLTTPLNIGACKSLFGSKNPLYLWKFENCACDLRTLKTLIRKFAEKKRVKIKDTYE